MSEPLPRPLSPPPPSLSTKVIEPIQSRCAILRYNRLSDAELLARLQHVCAREGVCSEPDGLEALIFTAEGDLRNALNNLQSTDAGFGLVTQATALAVLRDRGMKLSPPPPLRSARRAGDRVQGVRPAAPRHRAAHARRVPRRRRRGRAHGARAVDAGYAASDIIGTIFKARARARAPRPHDEPRARAARAEAHARARARVSLARARARDLLSRCAATTTRPRCPRRSSSSSCARSGSATCASPTAAHVRGAARARGARRRLRHPAPAPSPGPVARLPVARRLALGAGSRGSLPG